MRLLWVVCVLPILFCTCVDAGQPDAPQHSSEQAIVSSDDLHNIDPRLSGRITYKAEHKSVRVILDDLSRISGVILKAGYNNNDWQVRDRRMNVFANDIPLLSLMNSMAKVMKFKWSKSKEADPPTYRMYMDRKVLLEAEGQRYREERRLKERQTQKREECLDELSKLESLSEKEKADLRETRPWTYVLASTGLGESLGSLLELAPELRMAIASGEEYVASASTLTSAAQQTLLEAMQGMWHLESRMGVGSQQPFPQDVTGKLGHIRIEVNSDVMSGGPLDRLLLGSLSVRYEVSPGQRGDVSVELLDQDSDYVRSFAETVAKALEITDAQSATGMADSTIPIPISDMRPLDFGETVVEHADGPGLDVKVSLEKDGEPVSAGDLREILSAFAESTEFSVVSDSFSTEKTHFPSELQLKPLLDMIAIGYNYNWWKKGSVVELRDRHWYRKRSLQIPDRMLEDWRQKFRKNLTLSLDDLAEICLLSREQFDANIVGDEVLGQRDLLGLYSAYGEPLRFYAGLDSEQRDALFSEEGLWSDHLSQQQLSAATRLIKCFGATDPEDAREDGFVCAASYVTDERRRTYCIEISVGQAEPSVGWRIACPIYVEPRKDAEPKPEHNVRGSQDVFKGDAR